MMNIFEETIALWGCEAQLKMAIEETLELSHAILKFMRNSNDITIEKIEEEVADVEIMMKQLRLIFNSKKITKWKATKKRRLQKRIERAKNE